MKRTQSACSNVYTGTHRVYTGLALLRKSDSNILRQAQDSALTVTDVPMRDYSEEEVEAYVQTGDSLDKTGAYAIRSRNFIWSKTWKAVSPALWGCRYAA